MLAARYYNPGDIRVEDVPVPVLPPGGALLKVIRSGICGTDKRIYNQGHFHIQPGQPRILGHEVIGMIVELDASNDSLHVGQRVTLAPNIGCGTCRICQRGYTQLCDEYDAFGISIDGGFAEYLAIPEVAVQQGNVISVPENFSDDEGVMSEISACSYRGLSSCSPQPGETVLIIGGGAVTYLMSCWARSFDVGRVIISVIDDSWGEISQRSQPDLIINSRKEDLKGRIFEETDGLGADVVIVACSAKEMDELAPELAAVHGRINFFGGLPENDAIVMVNSRIIHYREVTITGTTGANPAWIRKTMKAFQAHPFDLELGISEQIPLEDITQAFDEPSTTPRLKVVVDCS
jgi:threonine dehydrogenase-like Zn-dependent dehydrogenase